MYKTTITILGNTPSEIRAILQEHLDQIGTYACTIDTPDMMMSSMKPGIAWESRLYDERELMQEVSDAFDKLVDEGIQELDPDRLEGCGNCGGVSNAPGLCDKCFDLAKSMEENN